MRRVVHCKKSPYDVYIGRPSIFGNPFKLTQETNRDHVIEQYRQWFFAQPELMKKAREQLTGKILGCHCAPKKCHGDILDQYVNEEIETHKNKVSNVWT